MRGKVREEKSSTFLAIRTFFRSNLFPSSGEDYDFKRWDVEGKHDDPHEVMNEVPEDDENECKDLQVGKLSACAEESFHNMNGPLRGSYLLSLPQCLNPYKGRNAWL